MLPNDDIAFYKDLAASKPPRRRNYVVRHWRGELSLPVSYFLNGLLLTVVFYLVSTALQRAVESRLGPVTGLVFVSTVWGLAGVITVWQFVGIWRAAGSHMARTGRAFWAGVVRILVVIGVISGVSRYATVGLPIVREHIRIAQGDEAMGSFTLHTLDSGREIEYSGAIVYGAADALEKLLRETPKAQVVRLHSTGGRITEARRMLDVIRQARVDTHVPMQCLSACTVAFLGGKNRYIHEAARLGFHAGSVRGISDADMVQENLQLIDHVVRMGVDRNFATRAYLTPSSDMWYPKTQELIAAGFVTAVSNGQFALPGRDLGRDYFVDLMKDIPLYRAIAQYEPEVFAKIIDINVEATKKGLPESELIARMKKQTTPLVGKYLPYASDEALLLFMGIYIDEMRLITAKKGAIACHAHVMEEATEKFDPGPYLGKAEVEKYLRLSELVIVSGAGRTNKPLPMEKMEPVFDRLWEKLLEKYGVDAVKEIAAMQQGQVDKKRTCTLLEAMYSEMLKFPSAEAAAMLRFVLAET